MNKRTLIIANWEQTVRDAVYRQLCDIYSASGVEINHETTNGIPTFTFASNAERFDGDAIETTALTLLAEVDCERVASYN